MRPVLIAVALLAGLPGVARAADTAADLYSQCGGSFGMRSVETAGATGGSLAGLTMTARTDCRELIERTWAALVARGQPICLLPDETVTDVQLEVIFLDWVRRYPQYLHAPPDEALYAAWEDAFSCQRNGVTLVVAAPAALIAQSP
jgi:Rap1a immunity proteins